jgi:hypothetical protein
MPNNYKGLNISGLKSTTKLSRVQVEPTVDFVEITDRGSVSENPSKLRTAGAGHQKRSNASPKSAIGTSIDMGGLWEIAAEYDYGNVSADTFVVEEDSVWIKRRKLMNSAAAISVDWSNITLEHTLDNPNPFGTSENDQFGMAVAMSSTHAIIGAEFEDDAGGTTSGKAYIFDVTTGSLLYTLDNPNPVGTSLDDKFAHMVAISNTYAMVGAFQEDETTGSYSSGKVYIYDLADGSLIKTLNDRNPDGNYAGDLFGFSVAISNTHAIVGAWGEDWGASTTGAAYIYNISSDGLFSQPIIIANPTAAANAYFGWAVALSDNYAIVSAPNENDADGSYSGKAHIFNLSDGSLVYTLDNPNAYGTSYPDSIGSMGIYHSPSQVTINDNYAVVGAPLEDDAGGDDSGKVYVFDMSDGSLAYTLDNPNAFGTSEDDYFGLSVAIDGDNILIVGAPYEDDDVSNNYPGKAYIFDLTDGSLVNTIDDPNAFGTTEHDRFGHAVAISDGRALISASREDDGSGTSANSSGKAYIFKLV